jgi:hypothetical protein
MTRARKQARTRSKKPVVIPAHPQLDEDARFIRLVGRRAFDDLVEIGRRLARDRDLLKTQRLWLAWLKAEFGWSRRTASRFIALYEARDKLGKLPTSLGLLPASALYELAKAPASVIEGVARRVEAGGQRRLHDIRQHIVAEQRPPQRIQITAPERQQSERRTLTTEDLREAAFRQAVLDLPRRLAEFADFLDDLPADDAAEAIKPEVRQMILADIRTIKTTLESLSEAIWEINKPKLIKDADDDGTTKH